MKNYRPLPTEDFLFWPKLVVLTLRVGPELIQQKLGYSRNQNDPKHEISNNQWEKLKCLKYFCQISKVAYFEDVPFLSHFVFLLKKTKCVHTFRIR